MKFFKLTLIILSIFVLSGCASKYQVTFDSNPQGAALICDGKNWGYTPVNLYYDAKVKNSNTLDVSNCSANWISGYKKYYPSKMRIYQSGGTVIAVSRPVDSDYEKDAQFALQVQQAKYQKRQAEAAEANAKANQQAADDAYWQNRKRNSELEGINDYLMLKRLRQ